MNDMTEMEQLEGMKVSQMVAKSVAKGKKVSQQQAFGALLESRQMINGITNTVGRVVQAQMEYEKFLQQINTNLGVLMSMLIDKSVYSQDDWKEAWEKYVIKPQEEAIDKRIEDMKTASAEDAFFAEVLNMVRSHDWQDREVNGKTYTGKQVRNFYVQMLLDPNTRYPALDDLRKEIPEIPELNLGKLGENEEEVQIEERQMPECKYCGLPTCSFCNQLAEDEKGE
jgi:hypothetical protein